MTDFFYLPEHLLFLKDSVEKTDDNCDLQIYSFKSCTNESSNELKAYRGLIFNGTTLVATSLGYTSEYNEDELSKIPEDITSQLQNYSFFPAEEGTLLRVFFHKKWYLSTHRKIDAFKSRWGSGDSFGEIFVSSLEKTFDELTSTLNPYHVYFFLIRNTKDTRVVSHPPSKPTIYHIGTLLNNETFTLDFDIGVPKQEKIMFTNMQEIYNYIVNLDPYKSQGIIAFSNDGTGKHIKLISSKYQQFLRIRDNEPDLSFRFLQLWRDQTSNLFQTFIELYKEEYKSKINIYTSYSFKVAKYLHNMYFQKFIKKEKIVCQKEEWSILRNVHEWFWAERTTRKVTFDVMYKMMLQDVNLRSYHRILKKMMGVINKNKDNIQMEDNTDSTAVKIDIQDIEMVD